MSSTESQAINTSIIQELDENAKLGFIKSVDVLYNNIIKFLRHRTSDGFRICRYIHVWQEFSTMMSPVHIGYGGTAQNSILLPDAELLRLLDAVRQKLTTDQILVGQCDARYITTNNVNYSIRFEIDLEVPVLEKQLVNTYNTEPTEIDFKCASC